MKCILGKHQLLKGLWQVAEGMRVSAGTFCWILGSYREVTSPGGGGETFLVEMRIFYQRGALSISLSPHRIIVKINVCDTEIFINDRNTHKEINLILFTVEIKLFVKKGIWQMN